VFADYSQWESSRNEQPLEKTQIREQRAPAPADGGPKKKLSYMEQREWDSAEAKILEAEEDVAACRRELEATGSDVKRYTAAYEKLQAAERRVEDLYVRWAELEAKVVK
jgi:ATP-binding cassette subfamily F protein uup